MRPTKVRFGHTTFKVQYAKDLENGGEYGHFDQGEQEISISERYGWAVRPTLWHELLHMIEHHYGLALEERQVTGLANGIMDMVVQNRGLAKWLIGGEKDE